MARSLTRSEQLEEKYTLPTIGMGKSSIRLAYAASAAVRPLTRVELYSLAQSIRIVQRGPLTANSIESLDGVLRATKVTPEIGGAGWARWPGADHWEVKKGNRVAFRSQNYTAVLAYFHRYVQRHDQTDLAICYATHPKIAGYPMLYVSNVPGFGRPSWGYTSDPKGFRTYIPDSPGGGEFRMLDQAKPLNAYWQQRFKAYCQATNMTFHSLPVSAFRQPEEIPVAESLQPSQPQQAVAV